MRQKIKTPRKPKPSKPAQFDENKRTKSLIAPKSIRARRWRFSESYIYWMWKDLKWLPLGKMTARSRFDKFIALTCDIFEKDDITVELDSCEEHPWGFFMKYAGLKGSKDTGDVLKLMVDSYPLSTAYTLEILSRISQVVNWNVGLASLDNLGEFKPKLIGYILAQWKVEADEALTGAEHTPAQRFEWICDILRDQLCGYHCLHASYKTPYGPTELSLLQTCDKFVVLVCVSGSAEQISSNYEELSTQMMVNLYMAFEHNATCPGFCHQNGKVYGFITDFKLYYYWQFDGVNFSHARVPDRLGMSTDTWMVKQVASKLLYMIMDGWLLANYKYKSDGKRHRVSRLRKALIKKPGDSGQARSALGDLRGFALRRELELSPRPVTPPPAREAAATVTMASVEIATDQIMNDRVFKNAERSVDAYKVMLKPKSHSTLSVPDSQSSPKPRSLPTPPLIRYNTEPGHTQCLNKLLLLPPLQSRHNHGLARPKSWAQPRPLPQRRTSLDTIVQDKEEDRSENNKLDLGQKTRPVSLPNPPTQSSSMACSSTPSIASISSRLQLVDSVTGSRETFFDTS